ncbi:hypothetical protein OV208_01895 [Corallococcus sp. bb12-1]|nr:hypothetical protein [Corallococcus sp. bb12-1]MCY1040056.1 hypothetical protein [Corallococcus sp. bb12-1]
MCRRQTIKAWGPTAAGNYLEDGDFGGHRATVTGKTAEGNAIVIEVSPR